MVGAADININDSFKYLYNAEQAHIIYTVFLMLIIRLAIDTLYFLQRKYWLYYLAKKIFLHRS